MYLQHRPTKASAGLYIDLEYALEGPGPGHEEPEALAVEMFGPPSALGGSRFDTRGTAVIQYIMPHRMRMMCWETHPWRTMWWLIKKAIAQEACAIAFWLCLLSALLQNPTHSQRTSCS